MPLGDRVYTTRYYNARRAPEYTLLRSDAQKHAITSTSYCVRALAPKRSDAPCRTRCAITTGRPDRKLSERLEPYVSRDSRIESHPRSERERTNLCNTRNERFGNRTPLKKAVPRVRRKKVLRCFYFR